MAFIDYTNTALLTEMDRETSQFDEWNTRFQEELGYLIDLPLDEQLPKIGALVDYYFGDGQFHHNSHDIEVKRFPNGGFAVLVLMDYADPQDYFADFAIDSSSDFVIRLDTDPGFARIDNFTLDPMFIRAVEEQLYQREQQDCLHQQIFAHRAQNIITATEETTSPPADDGRSASPDDILFAPIKIGEDEKKPEPVLDYTDCCD